MEHLKGKRDIFELEVRVQLPSGLRWMLFRGCAKPDEHGRCHRMSGSISDVTERRRAEEEVLRLNSALEQKVKERTVELEEKNTQLIDTLAALNIAQNELVQNDNLVSLGSLVSSMAHEVNTPIGVALTASSHMFEAVSDIKIKMEQGRLTKSDFEIFLILPKSVPIY